MSKSTVLLTLGQHESEPEEELVRKKRFWLSQGQ